jgi:hypothetical protein
MLLQEFPQANPAMVEDIWNQSRHDSTSTRKSLRAMMRGASPGGGLLSSPGLSAQQSTGSAPEFLRPDKSSGAASAMRDAAETDPSVLLQREFPNLDESIVNQVWKRPWPSGPPQAFVSSLPAFQLFPKLRPVTPCGVGRHVQFAGGSAHRAVRDVCF